VRPEGHCFRRGLSPREEGGVAYGDSSSFYDCQGSSSFRESSPSSLMHCIIRGSAPRQTIADQESPLPVLPALVRFIRVLNYHSIKERLVAGVGRGVSNFMRWGGGEDTCRKKGGQRKPGLSFLEGVNGKRRR